MFVILLNYLKPMADVEANLQAHRDFLAQQYKAGVFLASGPKVPRTGGVILAKGKSLEELLALTAQDPFIKNGVAEREIIEFSVNKAADSLASLLEI